MIDEDKWKYWNEICCQLYTTTRDDYEYARGYRSFIYGWSPVMTKRMEEFYLSSKSEFFNMGWDDAKGDLCPR